MKIFKAISLIVVALVFTSCSFFGSRTPSSVTKRHYIITMHGVRGNAESYGEFHQFVGNTLKQIDPTYEYKLFNWTYPVGAAVNDEKNKINWDPNLIAKKFNADFILGKNALIPELGPDDKISIIAYSMGGQMVMSWYYNTMFNFRFHPKMKYSESDYAKLQTYLAKVDNVIGLGPVYWGSLDAELGWTVLNNGDLSEIKKALPKLQAFCATNEVKEITDNEGFVENVTTGIWQKLFGDQERLTQDQANEKNARNIIIAGCSAISTLATADIVKSAKAVPMFAIKQLHSIMKSVGNTNPSELNHMRLTSDVINEFRLARIFHLTDPKYNERFKAKWTSIVGVFPCLGKKDSGLTCNEFRTESFKKINEELINIFSGLKRRETDGPVFSPGAVADFIFYIDQPGQSLQKVVPFDSFKNTLELQQNMSAPSKEIFVENMHATVVPAVEGLSGMFGVLDKIGQMGSKSMTEFDKSLGVDVVIMNKECVKPETCKHPNYKHVVETLSGCVPGVINCNQSYLNRYFRVSDESQRHIENTKLKSEMGSYVLVFNLRLPKSYKGNLSSSDKILKNIKFKYTTNQHAANPMTSRWTGHRVDSVDDRVANQIGRTEEVMSTYAVVREYADTKVVRAYFMGRAWAKNVSDLSAQAAIENGLPVEVEVAFPGMATRKVVAKVKPTYSTYVDLKLTP